MFSGLEKGKSLRKLYYLFTYSFLNFLQSYLFIVYGKIYQNLGFSEELSVS